MISYWPNFVNPFLLLQLHYKDGKKLEKKHIYNIIKERENAKI